MNDFLERKALDLLQEGNFMEALRLFSDAGTCHQFIVSSAISYGFFSEVIDYIKVLFHDKSSSLSSLFKTHFANLTVYCFVRQLQQLKNSLNISEEKEIKEDLKKYIQSCKFYDEKNIISLLVENELYDIARCCAEVRGSVSVLLQELEAVCKQSNQPNNKIAALICEVKGDLYSSMEYLLLALAEEEDSQASGVIDKLKSIFNHHILCLLHNPRGGESIIKLFLQFAKEWKLSQIQVEEIILAILTQNSDTYLFGIIFLLFLCKEQKDSSKLIYIFANKFILQITSSIIDNIENCTSIDMSSPTIMDMFSNEDDFFLFDAIRESIKIG